MILTIISPPGPVRPYTVAGPRQLSSWITVKGLGSASASVSRLRSEMKGGTPSEIFLLRVAPIMARYGWSLLPLDSVEPTDIFLPRPGEGEGPATPPAPPPPPSKLPMLMLLLTLVTAACPASPGHTCHVSACYTWHPPVSAVSGSVSLQARICSSCAAMLGPAAASIYIAEQQSRDTRRPGDNVICVGAHTDN